MSALRPTARVARGATYMFIQGFLSAAFSVVYFVVLARSLSQAEMGVFALLSFILMLPQVFGTFALPSASIKYISQYLAMNDHEKAKSVAVRILQVCLISSLVAFLLLFVPAEWLSVQLFNNFDYAFHLRFVALNSVFSVLYLVVGGFLQGLQRIRDVAAMGLTYTLFQNSVGIFLLYIGWGLHAVLYGWLAGLSASFLVGLTMTSRHLGFWGKPHEIQPLLKFSLPLYAANSIGYFVTWADQLILVSYMSLLYGAIEAQRILGVYYVAVRAAVVPMLFSTAIITVLFPQLSALYAKQGSASLRDAFHVSSRYAMLIGFPLITGVATLAYPIIVLFAGVEYAEAALPLIIISIAALISTVGTAIGPILLTIERTLIVSVLSVISVSLSVLLSVLALAVLSLGMVGTAWARTFAALITFGFSLYALSRYIKVSFDREALWKALAASACMVLAIVLLDILRGLLSQESYQFLIFRLHLLPIYVGVGGLTYFFSLVALKAIKKYDIILVYEYLPGFLKPITRWLERFAAAD